MHEANLFQIFTSRLEKAGVSYMVTGSVATIVYGEPRLTHDVDLVVTISSDAQTEALIRAFPDDEFYCAPAEVINIERRRSMRGHFNIIHHESGFKADVYIANQDPLHQWGLAQKRKLVLQGEVFWVAPPEYVIVRKLEFYREGKSEKHLNDIRSVLGTIDVEIDRETLEAKIVERDLESIWTLVSSARKPS